MPKKEAPITQLQDYLPPNTFEPVLAYLRRYHVHLTVARERKSILGDYRHRTHHANHRISVNGNLNKFSFLITLLHELAHLVTFEQFGNKVQSHGREWKTIYARFLQQFLINKTFPDDIEKELYRSLQNPAASSCAEDDLLRVLRNYDTTRNGHRMIEELPAKSLFRTDDGRIFRKELQLRKRYKCIEVATGRVYLFSPVYEVETITEL
ncbi:MAG TPA: SprT-like domain-containing protein [Chitinophagaceae bacterium]|nr:SprT-like domain-containing protein [Chitinophagaceae bacterium]